MVSRVDTRNIRITTTRQEVLRGCSRLDSSGGCSASEQRTSYLRDCHMSMYGYSVSYISIMIPAQGVDHDGRKRSMVRDKVHIHVNSAII